MRARLRESASSFRGRTLLVVLSTIFAGLLIAGGLSFAFQAKSASDRANNELDDEIADLRTLSAAGDAEGVPFESLTELLYAAMTADVPGAHESFAAMIDGEIVYVPAGERTVDITHPALLAEIESRRTPDRTVTTDVSYESELMRVAIVPVTVPGDESQGYFIIAYDLGLFYDEVAQGAWIYAGVSLFTLVLVGVLGAGVMARMLRPVHEINEVAERADANDLSARVAVTGSGDEIDRLGASFNSMLDRVQDGVEEQRRFLSDAGHELKTPLTIIRGNLEVVDETDPADVVETRDLVLDEVDRMSRIVADLSLLAAAGHADFIRIGPESAASIVSEVAAKASSLGPQRFTVATSVDQEMVIDRQRIAQALLQLCRNAVNHTPPESSVVISAAATSSPATHPEAGPAVLFRVADDGPGIPYEEQPHIFDRFRRGSGSGGTEGSGLGLAIVAAIAHAHGGWVDLESRPGHGAAFTIVIPRTPWRTEPAPWHTS